MIYTIGDIELDIPEKGPGRRVRTPNQVVPYRDMAETCRTLDAVCSKIPYKKKFKIIDGIARSGFWGAVFLNRWPDCDLVLNEEDKSCAETLNKNFKKVKIEFNNLIAWDIPKVNLILLDFDSFTLKKFLDGKFDLKVILEKAALISDWIIIADSTCFGFKFGNMAHYGVDTEEEYYNLLDKRVKPILNGKRVVAVSSFVNAAMVLFGKRKKGEGIEFIEPTSLSVSRGGKFYKHKMDRSEGLGLCG